MLGGASSLVLYLEAVFWLFQVPHAPEMVRKSRVNRNKKSLKMHFYYYQFVLWTLAVFMICFKDVVLISVLYLAERSFSTWCFFFLSFSFFVCFFFIVVSFSRCEHVWSSYSPLPVCLGRVTNLRRATYVVLDEADRMFDMGFEPQVSFTHQLMFRMLQLSPLPAKWQSC